MKTGDILKEWVNDKGKPMHRIVKTCPRCGGSGNHSYCQMYGTKCFQCEGRGMIVVNERALTEKEIVQRERAKIRRQEKKLQEQKELAERMKEHNNKRTEEIFFKNTDCIWVCIERDTYSRKEQIRAEGGRWNAWIGRWVFTKEVKGYKLLKITKSELIGTDETGVKFVREEVVDRIRNMK